MSILRRRTGTARSERGGFALMLALWLIVVLGVVATGVALSGRSSVASAETARARTTARYAAESGVTWAKHALESRLATLPDSLMRAATLNRAPELVSTPEPLRFGESRFQVAVVDVNARLDVNAASAEALARLFSYFGGSLESDETARAIRRAVTGGEEGEAVQRALTPIESLDALERIPGVSVPLLRAAAPYLTVDGDGKVNRATASDTVLAAAAGDLVDAPTRLLVVSRGWREGHPLTHEIQAVYAMGGDGVTLVRWRERER